MTKNRASIKWATFSPARCALISETIKKSAVKSNGIFHSLELSELAPGTKYEYFIQIQDSNGTTRSGPYSFRTAQNSVESWSFLVYGDTRGDDQEPALITNNGEHKLIVEAMARTFPEPEFYINAGDLVDRGERFDNWDNFFAIEAPLLRKLPFLPIRGNHDVDPQIFNQLFFGSSAQSGSDSWYKFEYYNALFVMLETGWNGVNETSVCSEKLDLQIPFLEKALKEAESKKVTWRFVCLHIPPFSSGNYGCNDELINKLVPIFEKYRVNCVFSAHNHMYERSVKNEVTYIVTGGGGAPFQVPADLNKNPYSVFTFNGSHFLQLRITPERVLVETFDSGGKIIEQFEI